MVGWQHQLTGYEFEQALGDGEGQGSLAHCSAPGLPVPHHLPKFVQVHIHCIGDAIHPSHLLTPSSPPALNLLQHQGFFQ